MAVTRTDEPESTVQTATVIGTVRVPNGADGDLALEAERRLSQAERVAETTVEGLRALEPRLSATVVTVEVTIRTEGDVSAAELRDRMEAESGVEDVELATH